MIAHWVNITRQARRRQLSSWPGTSRGTELATACIFSPRQRDPERRRCRRRHARHPQHLRDPDLRAGFAEQRLLSIRHSITKAQQSYYIPDGVVLNPADWELVETSRVSGSGEFVYSMNPQASGSNPTIWVCASPPRWPSPPATGSTGLFKMGATLWHRQLAQIFITDSHASNFTSNILVLLAELPRCADRLAPRRLRGDHVQRHGVTPNSSAGRLTAGRPATFLPTGDTDGIDSRAEGARRGCHRSWTKPDPSRPAPGELSSSAARSRRTRRSAPRSTRRPVRPSPWASPPSAPSISTMTASRPPRRRRQVFSSSLRETPSSSTCWTGSLPSRP